MSAGNQDNKTSLPGQAIAYAFPVNHIVVDGDYSDWSSNSAKYPLDNVFGKKPLDNYDVSAYFQTGYNIADQALYFVVVVSDDSHITDTSENAGILTRRIIMALYIDTKNLPSGSGVVSYRFNEIWKEISNPADSWDPEVKNASWDNVTVACKHEGSKSIYECRIILKDQIRAGRSIGIDHVITDKDSADNSNSRTYISWGDQQDKDNSPGRLGYVILMKAGEHTGTITGKLKWENPVIKGFPSRIRMTSVNNPALWVQASVDSTGRYSLALPQSTYEISPVWSFWIIDNDYYKIDRKVSKVVVRSKADISIQAPLLEFKTIAAPDLIPEKGILFDFDGSKEFLIDDFIKQYQEYYEIPGVSLAIIKDGQVVYHNTYGVKNTYTRATS